MRRVIVKPSFIVGEIEIGISKGISYFMTSAYSEVPDAHFKKVS